MRLKAEQVNAEAVNWVLSPEVAARFAGAEKSTGTGIYLMGDDAKIAGLPAYWTNQVPDNATPNPDTGIAILGDWSQAMLGIWGAPLDILVNPYEGNAYRRGNILVRALASVDVAIRHPEAFIVASDVAI